MSIIQRSKKSKLFPPSEYMKIIARLNVLKLLGKLYNDTFTVFGFYTRYVNIDGKPVEYRIMRIRSERTGKTHAVLFDFMVPYHQISSEDLNAVISGDTDDLPYSEAYIRWLTNVIRLHRITDYVSACMTFCRGHFIDKCETLVVAV